MQIYLNSLIRGNAALDLVGMPLGHAPAFSTAARSQDCVISSRELGKTGRQLAEEGYDSKGFRIKSKTCNFGPMAGFVCRNALFSKKGAEYKDEQEKAHKHALEDDDKVGWRGSTEQLCISEARLAWLQAQPDLNVAPRAFAGNPNIMWGAITAPGAPRSLYLMRREQRNGDTVWALYETDQPVDTRPVLQRSAWDVLQARPMLGMVNPYPAYPRGHYKNCVCGDYDLFAVWPRRGVYQPRGEDRRIAGMPTGNAQRRDQQIALWEDRRLGNISNRVHLVAQLINSLLPGAPGAIGGTREMVHHSDEGGRPHVTEIELPVIAFVPINGVVETVAADSLHRMSVLVKLCHTLGFQVILNAGWVAQLGGPHALGTTGDARGWQTPHGDPGRGR